MGRYDRKPRRVRDLSCGDTRVYLELEVRTARLPWLRQVEARATRFLPDNLLYTKRFA
jgi:hypothetical protein